MRYFILCVLAINLTFVKASQFESWQQHSNYYIQAHKAKAVTGTVDVVTIGDDIACNYRIGTNDIQDAINGGHVGQVLHHRVGYLRWL